MAASGGARAAASSSEVADERGPASAEEQRVQLSPSGAQPSLRSALRGLFARIRGSRVPGAAIRWKHVDAVDREIMVRSQAVRHPGLERAATCVSWFGFPPQSRLLPLVYAAILWIARFRLEAVFQLAAGGTAVVSTIIKSVMQRPRPVVGRDIRVVAAPLGGTSFPSGHVLTYVGIYGWMAIMAHHLIRPAWPRRLAVAGLTTLIAAVGPSRILLGHHWPSDVAASYLFGSGYLAALLVAYRRLQPRQVLR